MPCRGIWELFQSISRLNLSSAVYSFGDEQKPSKKFLPVRNAHLSTLSALGAETGTVSCQGSQQCHSDMGRELIKPCQRLWGYQTSQGQQNSQASRRKLLFRSFAIGPTLQNPTHNKARQSKQQPLLMVQSSEQ